MQTRAVLYARVSTRAQAEEGYSLEQQMERLREYAAEKGYEVIEEYRDPGYSGAKLERPGLDRVRDRVAAGGVDLVLAQDRDRFARVPEHLYILRYEFAKHDCKLRALNDRGDGSPEGELQDGILEQIAKYERANTIERTKRNKRRKAREGKIVGGHHVAYGYRYTDSGDGYEVDEATMYVVRRIFGEIAAGDGIRTVKERLDTEYVATPRAKGDKWGARENEGWSRPFIKNLILNDLYRPHTIDELRAMGVSDTVLAPLDADASYGVYRYDGIPVPVPDAGIDFATVDRARSNVLSKRASERLPSRAGNRFWELSGGVLRCAECERAMQPDVAKPRKTLYHYYRCVGLKQGSADRCRMRKNVRAEKIEAEVWDAVRTVYDDKELLVREIKKAFAQKRSELSGPSVDMEVLARRLNRLEQTWVKWQRAYEGDAISLADLKARRADIEDERGGIERALDQARNLSRELEALERQEEALLADVRGSGSLGETMWTPERRLKLYKDLQLRVLVGPEGHHIIFPFALTRQGETSVRKKESSPPPRCHPTPRSARP